MVQEARNTGFRISKVHLINVYSIDTVDCH
nr:MAG TPA: hypothetical protein [Caudoviricetes sp.]